MLFCSNRVPVVVLEVWF